MKMKVKVEVESKGCGCSSEGCPSRTHYLCEGLEVTLPHSFPPRLRCGRYVTDSLACRILRKKGEVREAGPGIRRE